jgi:predicted dinucleotide-binding enzyme
VTLLGTETGKADRLAHELGAGVRTGTSGEDQITGEIVILAIPYAAVAAVVQGYRDQLAGKIVVDITNPVDYATFDTITPGKTSGAEEIAKMAEGARVVKAFNTTFAGTLVSRQVAGQPLDVLIASDDQEAKTKVKEIAEACGLRVVDAGPLRRARQLEQAGLLHMQVQESLGTGYGSALKFIS